MSAPATLKSLEYSEADLSMRALTPRQIADELRRQAERSPYGRGIVGTVHVATTMFNESTRRELLEPKFGCFKQRLMSDMAQLIDSLGMGYWTGVRILTSPTGKVSVEVYIRI